MKGKSFLVLLLASFTLLCCESEKQPATFYPVDSLVLQQAYHLTDINAALFKEALLGGETDTITYTPGDTLEWKRELEVFSKLNEINKPVNKGRYDVTDGMLDPGSNLTVKAFISKEPLQNEDPLPVVYLKVYYQGNIKKPRKIEALYDEQTLLYKSARLLSMYFQQIQDETVLTSYSVKGGQKMVFGDSVAFYINGKILVD